MTKHQVGESILLHWVRCALHDRSTRVRLICLMLPGTMSTNKCLLVWRDIASLPTMVRTPM